LIHFVIPFYNNEKNLRNNVLHLSHFLEHQLKKEPYEIVLNDDGSSDRSLEIARELEGSIPRLRITGYSQNQGRGFAIKHATATCSGEFLIYADLDFPQTTNLFHILEMLSQLQKNQIVIGSRFLQESETKRRWPRRIVGVVHRLLVKSVFPWLGIKDPDAGFKGFHLALLKKMNKLSRMNRWSWDLEVLVIARTNGLNMTEIPIDWNEKHEKYVSTVRLIRDGWEEFRGMLQIKRNLRKGFYSF